MASDSEPAPPVRPPKPAGRVQRHATLLQFGVSTAPRVRPVDAEPPRGPPRPGAASPATPGAAQSRAVAPAAKATALATATAIGAEPPQAAPRMPAAPAPALVAATPPLTSLAAASAPATSAGLEPTVLLVGSGEKFAEALVAAFARHRVLVESSPLAGVVDAIVTVAPDLVLLVGDAAKDCGSELLEKLATLPQNFVVPIVVLSDETELDAKLRAFRRGVTAIIPRSASVDATAGQIAELVREIPERDAEALGLLGEATLEEFVATLSKQLRSGLEGAVGSDADAPDGEVRLVLGQGRPLAEFMDHFVRRVRRHVLRAEPLKYELDHLTGEAGDTMSPRSSSSAATATGMANLRILLADDDAPRADAVTQELRARGATVVVTDLDPSELRFQKLRQVDPTILIIGEAHVHGPGQLLLRRLRRDPRLRWASLLVVRWDEVWPDQAGAPAVERFESTFAGLAEPERSLRDRAERSAAFETRLEVTGPARCVRALASSGRSLRVSVENPRAHVTVNISDGLVVGAEGRATNDTERLEGVHALSALLVLGSGRVRVEPVEQPATANVMAPVDVALTMADAEPSPIAPSVPVAGTVSIHPPFQATSLDDVVASIRPAPIVPVTGPGNSPPRIAPLPAPLPVLPSEGTWEPVPVSATTLGDPSEIPAHAPSSGASPADEALPLGAGRVRHAFKRLAVWLATQDARLHEKRLSPAVVGSVLGLALLQVLFITAIAVAVRSIGARNSAAGGDRAAAAQAGVAKPAAHAAAPEPAVLPVTPQAERTPDGSGRSIADCQTLLADDPPPDGYYPGAAWQQVRAGRAAIVHGDLDRSQAAFCRAAHWDPKNPEVALQLAQVLLLARDGEQALEWASRAAELDPTSLRIQETLGDALARVGAHAEARSAWLKGARIEIGDRSGLRGLVMREARQADRSLRARDYVIAEKYFRRAAVLEPKTTVAMSGLAYVLLQLGDVKAAVIWSERAVKLTPRSAAARLSLGDALSRAGDTVGANAAWREANLLDPANREAAKRVRATRGPD